MAFSATGNVWHTHRRCSAVPAGGGAAPATGIAAQSDGGDTDACPPAAGLIDQLLRTLALARTAVSNFLELISLEARRAGLALVWMVICGGVAAICIVTAWLGLMAALVIWAVSTGFPPVAAAVAVAGINLAAGAVLIYVCIGMSCDLLFSATRRQLAGESPVEPPAP